ncbi:pectate lyase [Alistipes sp.]|uniref:pectate lyase n=1 Tax=Alistipes sp. TaxID=1872444 RepID=UPI003AF1BCCD
MKRKSPITALLLFALLLAACSDGGQPGGPEPLRADRSDAAVFEAVEGSAVRLEEYLRVAGGVPPYRYATSLQGDFLPSLERTVPPCAESPAEYGVYVRDSEGSTTQRPVVVSLRILPAAERLTAFPGAEGGGRCAAGGRGGRVYYVTNLLDGWPAPPEGSLRWALMQPGPKFVLFKVSGIIELVEKLYIRNDGRYAGQGCGVTVAGETAPGDGICLKNWPLTIAYAEDVVIRFLRFRLGDDVDTGSAQDACEGRANTNVILDHCSMSWSVDECASFYRNRSFTLQWCILTESLRLSNHEKQSPHGYGGIWGGRDASFHHNLLARHDSRNPRFDAASSYPEAWPASEWRGNVDFRNNVVYGWGGEVSYGGEGGRFNMVNNCYKEGPHSPARNRFLTAYAATDLTPAGIPAAYPEVYIDGNRYVDRTGKSLARIETDNFAGIVWSGAGGEGMPDAPGRIAELPIGGVTGAAHTATQRAEEAFDTVLAGAGAWPRDRVDLRAVTDARNGTATGYVAGAAPSKAGLVDTPAQVGGYPRYESAEAPADSDGDGMPDAWERARGLDPSDPSDGSRTTLSGGYTNLELYLHACAAALLKERRINEK